MLSMAPVDRRVGYLLEYWAVGLVFMGGAVITGEEHKVYQLGYDRENSFKKYSAWLSR